MESGATDPCWKRIEAALARIEAAVMTSPARLPGPGQELGELMRRHALLRDAAATSLMMIDELLADHVPEGAR